MSKKSVNTPVTAPAQTLRQYLLKGSPSTADWTVVSRPEIIRLGKTMQEGDVLVGEVMEIVASPHAKFKSKLLKIRHESGVCVLFPGTRTIEASVNDDLGVLLGKTVALKYLGKQPAAPGKKEYHRIELAVQGGL